MFFGLLSSIDGEQAQKESFRYYFMGLVGRRRGCSAPKCLHLHACMTVGVRVCVLVCLCVSISCLVL